MKMQKLGPGFNVQMQSNCDKCKGKGKTFKQKCEACRGNKVVKEDKQLVAEIEKGMPDGEQIVFERASEQSPDTVPGSAIMSSHFIFCATQFFKALFRVPLFSTYATHCEQVMLS